MDETIDLERFAALSAELDAGAQREELCAREGISVATWTAAQEAWLGRLADETARRRYVLTNRYNIAFVARRRALSRGIQVRRPPASGATPRPIAAPAPPPAVVAPPAFVAPPAAMPSYEMPRVAPPTAVTAPPRAPEPEWMEAEPEFETWEQKPKPMGTMGLPALAEPVLPFVQGPAPAQVAKPTPAARRPEPAMDGSTVFGAISPFAVGAALPFQQGAPPAPPPPAPARPPSAPPPPVVKAAKAAEPPMDGSTVLGAISPFAGGANPLPFARGAQTLPAPPKPAGANVGLPFAPQPAAPQPAPSQPAAPQPVAPQPVTPPMPQAAAKLTLEQFASLTAEIAVNPRAAAQIRARYGLDEAAHRAEAEAQHRRFQGDKAAYDRYLELFQSYRDYVARAQR